MNTIPRPEHPMPQWERESWLNLNGKWEFDFDLGRSARDRRLYESTTPLSRTINVPFCPESVLSGIGYTDFIPSVCYRRRFELTEGQLDGRVLLHFGAVDHDAYVYVNGALAGIHTGGYTSFSFDITPLVCAGENVLFVSADDDNRDGRQASGKQSTLYHSHDCSYTRTTGIWQTVWLEFTPKSYIKAAKYYPDIHNSALTIIGETSGGGTLDIRSRFMGRDTGCCTVKTCGGTFTAQLKLSELHLWELGRGDLYDLELHFGDDVVRSYFGMREVRMDGMRFLLNGRSVFQRLVLDQGFYPDGVYTASSDAALLHDVELSMAAGFNGARLHEKVFEPRFLYHCDRRGYMVWGEYPNWNFDHNDLRATERFLPCWLESVTRDFNHPSIIGWCPFNETWGYSEKLAYNKLLSTVYNCTKLYDTTRPVIDTSGNYHMVTDIYDVHDYDQDPVSFKAHYDRLATDGELYDQVNESNRSGLLQQHYAGEPVFVSEYGGIRWDTTGKAGWGYGVAPKNAGEFLARFKGLTDALLDNPKLMGLCYTQLYDVEQELNGLYTYEREPKFDPDIFRSTLSRKAAIED